jgi:hypothetical protein
LGEGRGEGERNLPAYALVTIGEGTSKRQHLTGLNHTRLECHQLPD